jgi:hypothetical protein
VEEGKTYFVARHGENTRQTKSLTCVFFRAHGKELIYRAFFLCRALYKKRTANKLFGVRPKKDARQRFWRTANTGFPVVSGPEK